ncbi:MAG: methyltransferase domain-containing protein [Planctomycetota bacterium]|nr:MAG: methyltransferase domain-containing protein [Planctomycetota bacterium]
MTRLAPMSFGLARGRALDPGRAGVSARDLPGLPADPAAVDAARLDPRGWFDDPGRPFEIEIGPGKGGFLVETALARPGVNILGVEWAREFWRYTADRCRRRGLESRVRVLHADAVEFLRWRCAPGVADVIHLYYSDPWPKKKHYKRRVLRDEFLAEAHRVLKPGGRLCVVTDHDGYWAWMQEYFERWCAPEAPARFQRLSDDEARSLIRAFRTPAEPATAPPRESRRPDEALVGTNYERKFTGGAKAPHAAVLVAITQQ